MDKNEQDNTALHYAAENKHLDIVKYFIKKRDLDPTCRGWHGQTPNHDAARNNHLEVAEYLVGDGLVDPLCRNDNGYTSLHKACQGGDIEVIRYLISQVKRYNSIEEVMYQMTEDGNTVVNSAALSGHLHIVKLFISEYNFDPNTPSGMVGLFFIMLHRMAPWILSSISLKSKTVILLV